MYIHHLRDQIQEDERQREAGETFWNVFGLPLAILGIVVAGIISLIVYIVRS